MTTSGNYTLCSYRYFNEDLTELKEWKERKNYDKVIYGSPIKIKEEIGIGCSLFIIEMNNSTNKVEGFGSIRNKIYRDKHPKIHSNPRFNRKIYRGTYRIDQKEFTEDEKFNVEVIEELIFSGKSHIKRGRGIQEVPDFVKNIKDLKKYKTIPKLECMNFREKSLLIRINEKNEKKAGSESYKRYENYKFARNKTDFMEMGGTNIDFNYDLKKGYISIVDKEENIIYNSKEKFDIVNLNTVEFIENMFISRYDKF